MKNPTKVVIVGAGGLGRELLSIIHACNLIREEWEVVGFLDPDPKLAGSKVKGLRILGDDNWCRNQEKSLRFVCAIGNPTRRREVVNKLAQMDCKFATVRHPDVTIPPTVCIGTGTVIMAGTRFTADAVVGSHVVIYLNCAITHDVRVEDFCLVASGCNLSGGAILESGVQLGTGVCLLPGKKVGAWATIGAGSVVTRDIPAGATAVGTPCKVISPPKER